jgi:hypothetical protein
MTDRDVDMAAGAQGVFLPPGEGRAGRMSAGSNRLPRM